LMRSPKVLTSSRSINVRMAVPSRYRRSRSAASLLTTWRLLRALGPSGTFRHVRDRRAACGRASPRCRGPRRPSPVCRAPRAPRTDAATSRHRIVDAANPHPEVGIRAGSPDRIRTGVTALRGRSGGLHRYYQRSRRSSWVTRKACSRWDSRCPPIADRFPLPPVVSCCFAPPARPEISISRRGDRRP